MRTKLRRSLPPRSPRPRHDPPLPRSQLARSAVCGGGDCGTVGVGVVVRKTDGTLHLYAQRSWHYPAGVAGTREALEALREAIDSALKEGWAELHAFTSDGEGYETYVAVVDAEQERRLLLPYTDEFAEDTREGVIGAEAIAVAAMKAAAR